MTNIQGITPLPFDGGGAKTKPVRPGSDGYGPIPLPYYPVDGRPEIVPPVYRGEPVPKPLPLPFYPEGAPSFGGAKKPPNVGDLEFDKGLQWPSVDDMERIQQLLEQNPTANLGGRDWTPPFETFLA